MRKLSLLLGFSLLLPAGPSVADQHNPAPTDAIRSEATSIVEHLLKQSSIDGFRFIPLW